MNMTSGNFIYYNPLLYYQSFFRPYYYYTSMYNVDLMSAFTTQRMHAISNNNYNTQNTAYKSNTSSAKNSSTKNTQQTQTRQKSKTTTTSNSNKKTVNLTKAELNRIKEIASKINCDYHDLLGVINNESGFSTTARSGGKKNGAVGLIQFTDIAIKDLNQVYGLNLTKDKIAKMSMMEQLNLTEKYLVRAKSFKFNKNDKLDSADLYAIVYRPAFAGKKVIARKEDGSHYTKNKGLDVNKDGVITKSDLAQVVQNQRVNVNLVA